MEIHFSEEECIARISDLFSGDDFEPALAQMTLNVLTNDLRVAPLEGSLRLIILAVVLQWVATITGR